MLNNLNYGNYLWRNIMTNKTINNQAREVSAVFNDQTKITQTIQAGIKAALLKHKQAGKPICEWKDDQVHWIPAENINVQSTEA